MSRALGRYELLRPLARGGMAEVYLARRRAAGVEKWLVVKRIRAQLSGDVRFLDLFVREARLSMSLTHQNIVPVFDFGRIDDQVFLAMERVEGKDLGSSLARSSRQLPPLVAAFVAAECCQALDYAHRKKSPEGTPLGIVHRDVTPRNVLLSWSGEVKLTDFGIAALAGDATTKLIGTPAYMAPEQSRGEPLDARADVYALGLVLRELLTGERARPGGDRDATLAAAKTGELIPWSGAAPAALVAIVDRATSPAADARFPDARAMLEALDDFTVADRAARKGDAPARQLAAWLDEVWGTDRDDAGASGEVEGNHLVSFLDDGALDVIGTGTERSMAATAAGDEAGVAPPPAPRAPEPPPVAKSRFPALALVAAMVGLGVGGYALLTRDRGGRAPQSDAALASRAGSDAEVSVASPTAPDAPVPAFDASTVAVDAAPPDAATKTARPSTKIDAGVAQVLPQVDKRKVTINAIPWAYFTVDDDPTRHETVKAIQLAPGPHTIHFDNPELGIQRDKKIDVPADRDSTVVERLQN